MKLAEFDYGKKCSDIAKLCIGLSGREISKLGVAWQVSCSRLEDISCFSTKTTFLWCSWEAFHLDASSVHLKMFSWRNGRAVSQW